MPRAHRLDASVDTVHSYVVCSLACDLHVTQLVDGNKGIHAMVGRELLA